MTNWGLSRTKCTTNREQGQRAPGKQHSVLHGRFARRLSGVAASWGRLGPKSGNRETPPPRIARHLPFQGEARLPRGITNFPGVSGTGSAPMFNRTRRHVRRGRGDFCGREPVDRSNKSLPCRFCGRRPLRPQAKSVGVVLKGDRSPFNSTNPPLSR